MEVQGDYVKNLAAERLEGLRRLFPEVDVETEGLRLVHEDPPGWSPGKDVLNMASAAKTR